MQEFNEAFLSTSQDNPAILDAADHAIFIQDIAVGNIVRANKLMRETFGYTDDEFLSLSFSDLSAGIFPEPAETIDGYLEKAARGQAQRFSMQAKDKNGQLLRIRVRLRFVVFQEKPVILGTVWKMEGNRQDDEQIHHLNRALKTVRTLSRIINQEKDTVSLVKKLNDCLVESGVYQKAALILLAPDTRVLHARATGFDTDFEELCNLINRRHMPGSIQQIIDTHQMLLVDNNSYATDLAFLRSGIEHLNLLVNPLVHDGHVYGILIVALPGQNAQNPEEQALFQDIASDIAFGIHSIHLEEERIKTIQDIEQRERKYSYILENIQDVISILDKDLNPIYVSPSITKQSGYTMEEIMSKSADSFLDSNLKTQTLEELALLLKDTRKQGSTSGYLETKGLRKDGSSIWIANSMSLQYDQAGELDNILVVSRNIQSLKETEKTLTQSEQRYRMLAENISDVIFTLDHNLFLTYMSPSIINLTGFTPEEALSIAWEEAIVSASLDKLMLMGDTVFVCLENESVPLRESFTLPMEMYCKDGSTIWAEATFKIMWTPDRQFAGGLGVLRDITARKKAEEALRQSEEKYRALVETSLDYVFMCDLDGVLTFANSCLEELLQDIRVPEKTTSVFDIVCPNDRAPFETALHLTVTRTKPVINFETRLPRRDDTPLYVNMNLSPQVNSQGDIIGIMGVAHDITILKKIEHDLVERNRELNDFAYMVSHELKNPIQIIRGFLNFIHNDPSLMDKYFDRVMRQSTQVLNFIDNLLQLSRAGRIIGDKSIMDLPVLLRRVFHTAKPESITAVLNISPRVPEHLIGDTKSFEQVFQNLLKNAINYRDNNKDRLIIDVDCEKTDTNITFSVKDNGIGIQENLTRRIFDAGFTVKRGEGTGFGLAIVKKIIEAHEGCIWAVSEGIGKGSTFYLQFPISLTLNQ